MPEDVSASFQAAVIEILSDRTAIAMEKFRKDFGGGALVIAGGVAANQAIGANLRRLADEKGFALHVPPPRLCNGQCGDDRLGRVGAAGRGRHGHIVRICPRPLAAGRHLGHCQDGKHGKDAGSGQSAACRRHRQWKSAVSSVWFRIVRFVMSVPFKMGRWPSMYRKLSVYARYLALHSSKVFGHRCCSAI